MSSDSAPPAITLVSAWTRTRRMLEAAGVPTPVLDARVLVEAAAGVSRIDIVTDPHRPITAHDSEALLALTGRRAAREPLAYILGTKDFWTLSLKVTPDVLTPRPETETLVEALLAATAPDEAFHMLDLGVGSGAILLAVLSARPNATGVGLDVSAGALDVARANAQALGLAGRAAFHIGDWGRDLEGPFDVIVSNPPYIETATIETLSPEVSHWEPRLALDGGADGLDAYRTLLPEAARLLKSGGRFALEIGQGQDAAVLELARKAGLAPELVRPDLAGIGRVVTGAKP